MATQAQLEGRYPQRAKVVTVQARGVGLVVQAGPPDVRGRGMMAIGLWRETAWRQYKAGGPVVTVKPYQSADSLSQPASRVRSLRPAPCSPSATRTTSGSALRRALSNRVQASVCPAPMPTQSPFTIHRH